MKNLDKYLEVIRKNVCSICVDSSDQGQCSLTEKEICAVQLYLPRIVDIIHQGSENLEELHNDLRDKICHNCRTSNDRDNCYLRDDANCALDRYFSIIVESVRKVDSGKV